MPELNDAWMARARCRDFDPEAMFQKRAADQQRAALACKGCPVRGECLAYSLELRPEFGVWGGLTERQRRALLRRRVAA